MQEAAGHSAILRNAAREEPTRRPRARPIPWREICTFLEAIEAEQTPQSFFERALERLQTLVPYDVGLANVADPSRPERLPVVVSHPAPAGWGHVAAAARRSISVSSMGDSGSPGFSLSLHRQRNGAFTDLEKSILDALLPHLHNLFRAMVHPADEHRSRLLAIAAKAGLSRREREIYVLLCGRLTIAEIAQRLFISRHTAAKHVEHIYDKLLVSGRRGACRPADGEQAQDTGNAGVAV